MKALRIGAMWVAAALLMVGVFNSSPAAQRAAPPTDVPRLIFEKYTLPNGLEVILSEDKRLPMVAVNLWYHVGPANEEPGRTGFAHLFEHMMFQGSKHVPPDTHFRFLESAGATDVNGTTGFDRTNYFETLPANQLELALWLESDRMGYLLDKLDAAALANQQDVVRNERRQSYENVPYGLAREALIHTIFPPGHPYYASVIGSHQDIQSARLDDVKRFFRLYYAPNNATLAIVGDFDKAQTKALVSKYFGTLKRGEPVPPIKTVTPAITEERRHVVQDRITLPRVYLAWLTPAIFKPGDADADFAAAILGGGQSSRLYKHLVYEKQIAQNVTANQQSLMLGSIFVIEATARPGHTPQELEAALSEEIESLKTAPPEAAEIERARNSIETRIVEGLQRLGGFGGVADRLNTYNHHVGTPDYLQTDVQRYRAVTSGSVQTFAVQYLTKNRAVVHVVSGQPDLGTPVPSSAATKATAEGAESINIDEPWRNTSPKAGPARTVSLPSPQMVRLRNGLTLMLSQRAGIPVVAANLVVRTGSDLNPAEKPGLASFTLAMLEQGTTSRSALQIADDLAQLGARLNTASTMDASFIRGQSLKKNFPGTLAIMADLALHPTFPSAEVERQRASRSAQLVQEKQNASAIANRVMAALLYGNRHPYGFNELGTTASVKAATRADLEGFWKQSFVPNNAALVVAGDISMSELRPLVEKTFGGWATGTPPMPVLGAPDPAPARIVIVDRPNAPQTQLRVAAIGAARSTPDFHAIQVMNTVLGGLFSSRINMNLREEHGYTYGASSQFSFRRAPGPFAVTAGVRTDVTAPSVAEILKELRGMLDRPLSAEELQLGKDALSRSLPGNFETNGNVAASFSNVFIYDLGLDYFAKYSGRVESVTADAAKAAASKYLQPDKVIVVAVGDRAKIQPELEKLNLGKVEVRTVDDE